VSLSDFALCVKGTRNGRLCSGGGGVEALARGDDIKGCTGGGVVIFVVVASGDMSIE
jgi:hypothetical protein